MIRKLALFVVVTALIVSACGRQVTPNPVGLSSSGQEPGFMQIKFRVAQPLDFTDYRYVIVFNTSGTGTAPYANGSNTNYLNYSFEFIVGGAGGVLNGPALYEFYNESSLGGPTTVQPVQIPYATGTQVLFNPDSNGLGTEFSIIFQRSLLYGIPLTAAPSPTNAPTAGATASPTPTPTPVGNNPYAQPTSASQSVWYYNFFTAQVNGSGQLIPLDALGDNGVNDVSFGPGNSLDTQAPFDTVYYVPVGAPAGPTGSTTLTGSEISNAP